MAAGEVSGDRQAAHLARALLRQNPNETLYGSGGDRMREADVDIRVYSSRYGSVGFQESLRFIRPLRRVMGELQSLLRLEPPDIAVLVDNEGFNGLLARFLHKEGTPFIYYFPPRSGSGACMTRTRMLSVCMHNPRQNNLSNAHC